MSPLVHLVLSAPTTHYKVVHNEMPITFHGLLIIFTDDVNYLHDARNLVYAEYYDIKDI